MNFLYDLNCFFRSPCPDVKRSANEADHRNTQEGHGRFLFLLQPEHVSKFAPQNQQRHSPEWCMSGQKINFLHASPKKKGPLWGPFNYNSDLNLEHTFQFIDHIQSFPCEPFLGCASEVTVGSRFRVNWTEKIEALNDRLRSHIEKLVNGSC